MKNYWSWILFIFLVLIIVGSMVWYASRPGEYDTFATCIKESGATFFGAFWCPHCQEQKSLFGKSAIKLPYVECSTIDGKNRLAVCADKKIETYPTWELKDGTRKTGTFSLTQLSDFTGCPLIKD